MSHDRNSLSASASKSELTHIDVLEIGQNRDTRFPIPEHELHASTADYPGLLRAADLIGQLADINYLRKISALFAEFRETGVKRKRISEF